MKESMTCAAACMGLLPVRYCEAACAFTARTSSLCGKER
jgi:hypothetical protein